MQRPRFGGILSAVPRVLAVPLTCLVACALPTRVAFHGAARDLGPDAGDQPVCRWLDGVAALEGSGQRLETVDWQRDDVVMLSLGQQGTTGHTMHLKSVRLDAAGTIVFDATHGLPSGPVGEAITHPGLVVRLEKGHAARPRRVFIDGVVTACSWR